MIDIVFHPYTEIPMCENQEGTHFHSHFPSFEECVAFHGHACPGLATGYRVATAAMKRLGVARPNDEELVCVAETDACGVDAIQVVTGCTAGKGNLIIHDYGKHVFSFFSRNTNRAIRVRVREVERGERSAMDALRKKVFSGTASREEEGRFRSLMQEATAHVLSVPEDALLQIVEISSPPPVKARIFATITCACCGEPVADAKTRVVDGSRVCIPCAESREQGRERCSP